MLCFVDISVVILGKDMKKKKNKRLKDMEKRFSEKGVDLMDAYTDKPVKEEVKTVSIIQFLRELSICTLYILPEGATSQYFELFLRHRQVKP